MHQQAMYFTCKGVVNGVSTVPRTTRKFWVNWWSANAWAWALDHGKSATGVYGQYLGSIRLFNKQYARNVGSNPRNKIVPTGIAPVAQLL